MDVKREASQEKKCQWPFNPNTNYSSGLEASLNQAFMNANQRLLNNVERGCYRIGRPERTKVKCPEKKEKLEIAIFAL